MSHQLPICAVLLLLGKLDNFFCPGCRQSAQTVVTSGSFGMILWLGIYYRRPDKVDNILLEGNTTSVFQSSIIFRLSSENK